MESITVEKLTKVFELWIGDYRQNPSEYFDDSDVTVEEAAVLTAEHLIKLLSQI